MTFRARINDLRVILSALVLLSSSAHAGNFFQNCSDVLPTPGFDVLQSYLQSKPDAPVPGKCFRLNNQQFLMTITETGRVAQGLYYFDAKTNTFGLSEGRFMPNIEVVREFIGLNNKRYVLLSSSNLSQGTWDRSYSVLNLVPMRDGKSYIHYGIVSWSEDAESGLCGHRISTDPKTGKTELHKETATGTASSFANPEVTAEGTDAISLAFPVTEQNCETSELRNYKKIFRLKDGRFQESGA